jgi:hypothetical protein
MASAKARRRNVLGSFKIPQRGRVTGRNILLVHDVVTTGGSGKSADSGAGPCCPGGGNARIGIVVGSPRSIG